MRCKYRGLFMNPILFPAGKSVQKLHIFSTSRQKLIGTGGRSTPRKIFPLKPNVFTFSSSYKRKALNVKSQWDDRNGIYKACNNVRWKHIRLILVELFHLLSILHICAVIHFTRCIHRCCIAKTLRCKYLLLFNVRSTNRWSWFPRTIGSITERWKVLAMKAWQLKAWYNLEPQSKVVFF